MRKTTARNITPAALAAAATGDLHNALIASTPGGIEAQEKAGQAMLVASSDMPKEMRPGREAFEKLGFQFGAEKDELFFAATLPPGWTRKATDHSMHSVVLDEQGRERVGIFYKAAFYDRRAHAYLKNRFSTYQLYSDDEGSGLKTGERVWIVQDCGKEIFRTDTFAERDWEASDKQSKIAGEWLRAKFVNADDPTANW